MDQYELKFPEDFADHAWEVEIKGWFGGIKLSVAGKTYELIFYDPTRLSQEVEDGVADQGLFFEPNLVVVKSVNEAHIRAAAHALVSSGRYEALTPLSPGSQ